jgi:hypothetical protein
MRHIKRNILFGLMALFLNAPAAFGAQPEVTNTTNAANAANATVPPVLKRADFMHGQASAAVRQVADWIVDSGDNQGMPFVIVDKTAAEVFVFQPDGRLRGASPALMGLARGDESAPGIGQRKLARILPEERTTPAGRFVAALGRNAHGVEILWIDYDTALSMHRVIPGKAEEQRATRLATPTPLDNRITYGCINVPVAFYTRVVSPSFKKTNGVVYVLPEVRAIQAVFALYDVDERTRLRAMDKAIAAQATDTGAH